MTNEDSMPSHSASASPSRVICKLNVQAAALLLAMALVTGCASAPKVAPPAVSQGPDPKTILIAADASQSDGRYGEALQIYESLLRQQPHLVAAQVGAAECLLRLARPNEAKAIFESLQSNPELKAFAVQGRGLALLALDQREQAGEAFRSALALDNSLWRSWNALGMLADLNRDWPAAQEAYGHALALKGDAASIRNNLGYSKFLAGQVDGAVADLRIAIAIDPSNTTIQNNMRVALAAKGSYREATRGIGKENQAVVLNNVGYIAMQRGDLTTAEGYFARAMESSSSYNDVAARNIEALRALRTGEK